ncbi:MAG: NUDIX hydrolase [Rhizobiales bacterium]|nr:NUDIX hydrolase [Hyphomicrobiales bacterium]MBI3673837.1 NUDIX hydrolase [Hyphomicrobiales bacterium]
MTLTDPELQTSQHLAKAQVPRDAATLIVVRRDGGRPRILMGQRHAGHAFMPNKFVFPGGRLDAADCRVHPSRDLHPDVLGKLTQRMRSRPSAARARGLAIAALRETFEETGLLIGRRQPVEAPDLSGLVFFARAITPPGRTRRFDSRFFVCGAESVANLDNPHHDGSGELLTLTWFTLEETLGLDLPSITKDILARLRPHLDRGTLPSADGPVSFQYHRRMAWREETL